MQVLNKRREHRRVPSVGIVITRVHSNRIIEYLGPSSDAKLQIASVLCFLLPQRLPLIHSEMSSEHRFTVVREVWIKQHRISSWFWSFNGDALICERFFGQQF